MRSSSSLSTAAIFAAGAATMVLVQKLFSRQQNSSSRSKNDSDNKTKHAGATAEGDDLSLYYSDDIASLKQITPSRKFLPSEVYGSLVQDCVVCCVDILLVRRNAETNQKECLLVLRSSEPAKGYWWWPGGRLLKGESFFDAAIRKAKEETGITSVKPMQVLGVWNTFFPTSSWDTKTKKGTQTVNPIVLVELLDNASSEVKLDAQSEGHKWIGLSPQAAEAAGEDPYVYGALYRLEAWNNRSHLP